MQYPVLCISFLPADGMALFPFILVKRKIYKKDNVLIRHENIHLQQQLELLIVFFYLIYLLNYIFNLARYRSHHKAYFNIIFEKEAYDMEKNEHYLRTRQLWAWLKYLEWR